MLPQIHMHKNNNIDNLNLRRRRLVIKMQNAHLISIQLISMQLISMHIDWKTVTSLTGSGYVSSVPTCILNITQA